MTVNIYTYTTAKGARNKTVGFAYVLETIINGKAATVSKTGVMENAGKNEAEIKVFKEALQRVKEGNAVILFTQSSYLAAVLNSWLHEWMRKGINSMGEIIAPIYKEIADLLVTRPTQVKEEGHEYLTWLKTEAEREKNERGNN